MANAQRTKSEEQRKKKLGTKNKAINNEQCEVTKNRQNKSRPCPGTRVGTEPPVGTPWSPCWPWASRSCCIARGSCPATRCRGKCHVKPVFTWKLLSPPIHCGNQVISKSDRRGGRGFEGLGGVWREKRAGKTKSGNRKKEAKWVASTYAIPT